MNNALTLYRSHKTGDCSIEIFVGTRAVGKFVNVTVAEMQERGLEIILKCLNGEVLPNPADKPEMATWSKEEERTFRRLHRGVSIYTSEGKVIKVGILRRQGSGYVVLKEDVIQLPLPCTNKEFLTILNRAFTEF